MKLQRQYAKDETGAVRQPPSVTHCEVIHTGTSPEQHFSTRLVAAGLAEGWMTISKGQLILHGKPEDLVYTIKRVPGEYRTEDGGKEVIHYYDCVLDEAQHQRFCAQAKGGARG